MTFEGFSFSAIRGTPATPRFRAKYVNTLQIRLGIVVGYTGKSTAAGYYLTVPMFQGTDGEGVLIKDIVPTTTDEAGVAAGDFAITLMKTDRSPLMEYTYKPYKKGKGSTPDTQPGWYDVDGKLDTTSKVTYGEGFMLYAQKQVTLTFAGQVVQTNPSLVANAAGYYRAGNITPVAVSITNLVPTADSIAAGDFAISTYDNERKPEMEYTYKPYKKGKGSTPDTQAGWYDTDGKLETVKTFLPGEGFVFYTQKAVTLTFPNPIKKAE